MAISISDPISLAFNRAKYITFQPFNVGKWFTLGFVAFLATLDQGGGGNINTPGGGGGGGPAPAPAPGPVPGPGRGPAPAPWPGPASSTPDPFEDFGQWLSDNLGLVILGVVVGLAVLIGLWLLILWLSSRGKFMFLEGIARNTYDVVAPW